MFSIINAIWLLRKLQENQICPISFHLPCTFCMLCSVPLVFTPSSIFCGKASMPPPKFNLLSRASSYDLYSIYTVIQMKEFCDCMSDIVSLMVFLLLHKKSMRNKKLPLKISIRCKLSDSHSLVGLLKSISILLELGDDFPECLSAPTLGAHSPCTDLM